MNKILLSIACVLVGMTWPAQAAQPSFHFQKQVAAAAKPDESLVAVTLDADVFAATQPGLADIRLLDAQGAAVPFLIRKSEEVRTRNVRRTTWTAGKPALRPLDGGGLEITLTLADDDPQPNGLSLITPLRNFEQRVRVLTSADGEQWEPAGAEAVIFDYSRFMDVRSDKVPFDTSARRHFRIVIDDVTAEQQSELLELTRRLRGNEEADRVERVTIDRRPFRIDRIDFWQDVQREQARADRKQSYPVVAFGVAENPKAQQTIITIDTRREPLTSLELETAARNFSRHGVVEVEQTTGVQTNWKQIGEATLSRIDFKNFQREQLAVEFPETRQTRYRLVIDNRDSAPLAVSGVKAKGNVYELVFLSPTNKPHQLVYSDPDAEAPKYDTAAIQTLLTERYHPEQVQLGPEQNATTVAPPGFKWSRLVNDPRLLTCVIGLLVLILGWGLYRAAQRTDIPPPTAGE